MNMASLHTPVPGQHHWLIAAHESAMPRHMPTPSALVMLSFRLVILRSMRLGTVFRKADPQPRDLLFDLYSMN